MDKMVAKPTAPGDTGCNILGAKVKLGMRVLHRSTQRAAAAS